MFCFAAKFQHHKSVIYLVGIFAHMCEEQTVSVSKSKAKLLSKENEGERKLR
jgi:hypothetical protein